MSGRTPEVEGHIYVHNAETKESSMYLSNSTFAQVDATDYILSADRKFVIFESNYSKLWRHSFTAYVWEYNIYLKKNATAEAVQVTHNGKVNEIHNGVPDWVYEEEVFASNEAIWWSPQGKYLAYLQINDTGVHNIEYSLYGNDQYPTTVFIPYPKAGCVIPRARLFVIDVENPSKQSEVVVPKSVGSGDHYLRTVTWVTDERLAVQWLPRRQDSVLLQIYDYDGTNWKETSVSFFLLLNRKEDILKNVGKWTVDGKFSNDSHPKFSLRNILKKKLSLVLRISISKSGHLAPECLTCSLYQDRCQYNSAYFSLNASFFRMDCYGYNYLKQLFSPLQKYLEYTEYISVFSTLSHYRYGGPASQNTDYVFRLEWATYLCSTEKVIIASFDGRGSGYQGDEIMHAIYGRLGTYEVEDQISAMRKLIEMGFIDKNRIGMWGWSYGGYVTSMVLGSGCGLLKCGIAVAPVAKWEYYDAVYTERYMHRPEENMESYKNSTVTGRAKNFKSVQYMLVHGTADDNVHFQQAAQISKALVENQVDFEAMWYTDKDHGLSGKARYHLYTHLNHFLQNCFAEKK
uniref:Dipeptidyl peptidase 4-like n=1 Tax=Sinocyclocheilus anshuiensis TaxID=1608454 RepID=A0A671QA15_9TELE